MAEATQTKTTIAIDPVTRIEGHLKAEVVVENGKVVDAKLTGGMYRGFESILRGRHPVSYTHLDVYKRQAYTRRRRIENDK